MDIERCSFEKIRAVPTFQMLAGLLFLSMMLLASCSGKPVAVAVRDISDIPEKIAEEVRRMPIEEGYYIFHESYAGEALIMICGDRDEPFELQIERADYQEIYGGDGALSLELELIMSESPDLVMPADLSNPVVFLSVDPRTTWVKTFECGGLELMGRRTTDIIEADDEQVDARVISYQGDIPSEIWNCMMEADLQRGVYEVYSDSSQLDQQYYLISGGDADWRHCGLVIEDFSVPGRSYVKRAMQEVRFDLELHLQYTASDPLPYLYRLKKPYLVLKVSDRLGADVGTHSPGGPHVIDDRGNWLETDVLIIK